MHQTISLVGIDWLCLFKIISWRIWKNLNLLTFQGISWSIEESWVCLNTDGSVRQEEGFVAVGGLVRDQNGRWIMGYGRYLGNCTVTEAELWGLMDGLNRGSCKEYGTGEWIMGYNKNLCKCSIFDVGLWGILNYLTLNRNMSYDGVRIQSNSMEVVKAIQDSSPPSSNYALVRRIQHLLVNVKSWVIQHLSRECNKIAFEEIPREVLAVFPTAHSSDSLTQRNIM
ncbi:hypothetical protein CXB51_015481 [Gossypium anomalum]|uniref:RNase H type-1 domain-containing protein n=1 Tax=Gossypium anomalum TaxID=47600 RepID=A0A8J5YV33_9ROSI|nr:hypothetical protein CXB51_015481 [Gossypium anomalum]